MAGNSGSGAINSILNNCTLIGNTGAQNGGGAFNSVLNNCMLSGNWANTAGGGAHSCTLNNCLLTGNRVSIYGGGGAANSTLNNCTLTGNTVDSSQGGSAGGAIDSTLNNCIVYYNTSSNYSQSTLNYCCTIPLPSGGSGNITNEPLFVSLPAGDFHLQTTSPCINAGNNAFVSGTTDLDGNPRIVGGTVDIGAYEFQAPTSMISYAWLQQFGLPTDGSADFVDTDHDGMNNWQEWVCGTDPTNALSVLRMLSATRNNGNVTVNWQSVLGVNYFVQRTTALISPLSSANTNLITVATNVLGQAGITTYQDTTATGDGPFFYRVGVTSP